MFAQEVIAGTTATGTAGAALGATTKTVIATKLAAQGAALGGVVGIVLVGAAVAGMGYLGYRLIKDVGAEKRPSHQLHPEER